MFQNCSHKSISINLKKGIRGFTLIELLIVMAIIGVLAGISLFAMKGARESARDTRRKADLETIRSALELYKADCNSYVNASGNVTTALDTDTSASVRLVGSGTPPSTCPTTNVYLEKIPNDSLSGRNYSYTSTGSPPTKYTLCAALEEVTTAVLGCGSCGAFVNCSYKVTEP